MKIKITGIPPYDGEYPVDMGRLTNRDIHTIKQIAGYTPPEYIEAGRRGDNDFVIALAIIGVRRDIRHRGTVNEDAFWDAEIGTIELDVSEEEAAGGPPTISEPETPSTPSGESSNGASELPQVRSLPSTGTRS